MMKTIYDIYLYLFQPEVRLIIAFLLALIFNFYAIPIIIRISHAKKLFDVPDGRKRHTHLIPTLGGLGIYATVVTISLVMVNTCGFAGGSDQTNMSALPQVIAGLTILFFIGMKDDLISISPRKKLIAQLVALFVIIAIGNLRITSLQGMFTVGHITYPLSFIVSLFTGIVIINSFNLIDGIDGLAASIAILACFIFGVFFLAAGDWEYAIFAGITIGAIIPFFLYNAYGVTNKIFMGDTGSLVLGFILTILAFRFNENNLNRTLEMHLVAAPAFSVAVLIIPLFDTLRVFGIRLLRGGSPFKPDRRHLHHVLTDLGFSHLETTSVLITVNIAFIALAYFLNFLGNSNLVMIMLAIAVGLSLIAIKARRKKFKITGSFLND